MGYRDDWDNGDEHSGGGDFEDRTADEIPDGTYDAEVVDFSIFRGKDNPEWFASWWFKLTHGVNEGAQIQRFTNLETGFKYCKADVRLVLGELPAWDDLVDEDEGRIRANVRSDIVGTPVKIRQKTRRKGGKIYVDVFINKVITGKPKPRDRADSRPEPADAGEDELAQAEERHAEERADSGQDSGSPLPKAPPAEEAAEGWGDPDCEHCKGTGCDECADF